MLMFKLLEEMTYLTFHVVYNIYGFKFYRHPFYEICTSHFVCKKGNFSRDNMLKTKVK